MRAGARIRGLESVSGLTGLALATVVTERQSAGGLASPEQHALHPHLHHVAEAPRTYGAAIQSGRAIFEEHIIQEELSRVVCVGYYEVLLLCALPVYFA